MVGPAAVWLSVAVAVCLLAVLPVIGVAAIATGSSDGLWAHLAANVLPRATLDTLMLMSGVGLVVIVVGTGCAWMVTACDFPGRRIFEWALLLPLAVPTYIVAFCYVDVLHPLGAGPTALRALLGITDPRGLPLPVVRSMPGAMLVLGLVLYPYVYVPARALFAMQAANVLEASRTLGASRWRTFRSVALPLAWPAVAAGASLALMETLNDIGASSFLGIQTLTVSIYVTWLNRSSLTGAAQIAMLLLALVLLLILVERFARRDRRFASTARQMRPLHPRPLGRAGGWLTTCLIAVPILLGFVVPVAHLANEAIARIRFAGLSPTLFTEMVNTVLLAVIATPITVVFGLIVAYAVRRSRRRAAVAVVRIAGLGYAVPGTVLAIGLVTVLATADAWIGALAQWTLGVPTGLLLTASGAALIYAYVVRFLAIATNGVEAGLANIPTALDDAASVLNANRLRTMARVHVPILWPALSAAGLLVFVDVMKELPATLLLRPVGFETLATHVYAEASRGTYEDGAVAALLIVVAGLGPVVLLSRLGRRPHASVGATTGAQAEIVRV